MTAPLSSAWRKQIAQDSGGLAMPEFVYSRLTLRLLSMQMTGRHFLLLIILAASWGASFLFMRVAAPVLGPAWLIEWRVLIAAIFLSAAALFFGQRLPLRNHLGHYLVLGFFNSAMPFLLFAYAAQTLSASLLSIVNATAPFWGALIGRLWLKTPISNRQWLGLTIGFGGVVLLVGSPLSTSSEMLTPLLASLAATGCYGIASCYAQTRPQIPAFANAHGSMWASVLWVMPFLFLPAPEPKWTLEVTVSVFLLGSLCTGVAYLLYFKLVREAGAANALTVTFLIPVFGILWGMIFLNESLQLHWLFAAPLVLLGTALTTGFRWRKQPTVESKNE